MERSSRIIQHPKTTGVRWFDTLLMTVSSLGLSILLGALWGMIAAVVVDSYYLFVGAMIGGFAGLLLSPVFLFSSLRSGVFATAAPLVLINAVLAVTAAGLGSEAGPLLAFVTTCIAYIAICMYVGSLRLRTSVLHIAGACDTCGYAYLEHEVCDCCPQCGQPRPEDLPPPTCYRCGYELTGLRKSRCPECGTPVTPPAIAPQDAATASHEGEIRS